MLVQTAPEVIRRPISDPKNAGPTMTDISSLIDNCTYSINPTAPAS